MRLNSLDTATAVLVLVAGAALVAVARWAGRRRGSRWDSFVALRVGDVLVTELFGAFLVGYAVGSLIAPQQTRLGPGGVPPPPVTRFGPFGGVTLPIALGLAAALAAALTHFDPRDLLIRGSASRNALTAYIGWDARVVAAIPAGGYGEIAMRDGAGNLMAVVATADTDVAAGTVVRVTGTRGLNLVVAPLPG